MPHESSKPLNVRLEGRLKTWNNDKGFGFITPTDSGADIFIHISDYPRRDGAPRLGEPLTFLVAINKDGKKKAISVQRSQNGTAMQYRPRNQPPARSSIGFRLVVVLVVAVLGFGGYKYFDQKSHTSQTVAADPNLVLTSETPAASNLFRCDGRRHCSQMTSCAEAKYFQKNCPNTEMDGDGDGIPCESQWCTGSLFK
ncbi:excalibur calcium-binding domain-containing protein [Cupriavidus pauculus]|uniref:excalibur calcium-binding domain-containing protein n=1 Tax=Cupriavidus pauculus TaxID=82633 RepID=UPI001EE29E61|nr:excalibur calcium-binding domain-containing protein [Cupriavidus pauculus]GJG97647.1 DNA-binding protein [Cupriavidus pauculus]